MTHSFSWPAISLPRLPHPPPPLAGKAVTLEQQEAALEGVLDLCRQPGFVHDMFANCDCRCACVRVWGGTCLS